MQALVMQPAVLAYAPLLHTLPNVPGGVETLKDVRHECTAVASSSIAKLMSTCCSEAERRIAAAHDKPGACVPVRTPFPPVLFRPPLSPADGPGCGSFRSGSGERSGARGSLRDVVHMCGSAQVRVVYDITAERGCMCASFLRWSDATEL